MIELGIAFVIGVAVGAFVVIVWLGWGGWM